MLSSSSESVTLLLRFVVVISGLGFLSALLVRSLFMFGVVGSFFTIALSGVVNGFASDDDFGSTLISLGGVEI